MQPESPCPAPACWWPIQASGLLLHWQFQLGTYFVGFFFVCFFFVSQFSCFLRFRNSLQTHLWEGFLPFGNFSFTTPSSGWVSVPNSFVSLFVFYILSYLILKRMGCLSGCLVSSTSIQKLFVEVAQHWNDLLMNFGGRKWLPHPVPLPLGTARYCQKDLFLGTF